jgi:hypothetical protein
MSVGNELNIKTLIGLTVADIDIFLLQNEAQTEDLEKDSFTKAEIREQLHKTVANIFKALDKGCIDIEKPLLVDSDKRIDRMFTSDPIDRICRMFPNKPTDYSELYKLVGIEV